MENPGSFDRKGQGMVRIMFRNRQISFHIGAHYKLERVSKFWILQVEL